MQFREAVLAALTILQEDAKSLFECSTINGAWLNELHSEAEYNHMICVIKALRDGVKDANREAFKAEWHSIDYAPKDRRLLVKSESGEVYAAHWVQDPMTGDEAFCVSEAPDGTQHMVRPVEWREIDPPDAPDAPDGRRINP